MKPFSDLTGKERTIELVRWLLVLPAAGLAAYALIVVAGLAMPRVYAQPPGVPLVLPSDFQRFVLPRIFGVLIAAAFVIVGAVVAPRGRARAAIVLAALWIGFAFLIHIFVHLGRGKLHYLDFSLAILAAGSAAAYIIYASKKPVG